MQQHSTAAASRCSGLWGLVQAAHLVLLEVERSLAAHSAQAVTRGQLHRRLGLPVGTIGSAADGKAQDHDLGSAAFTHVPDRLTAAWS